MPLLLLFSGPIAVGKSAVAQDLVERHGFRSIRSGAYLAELAARQGKDASRATLQQLGDALDEQTDYRWLIDVAAALLQANSGHLRWLLDSVRKERQVEHFRARFSGAVTHVHLTAPEPVLRDRYMRRLSEMASCDDSASYETAIEHPNEIASRSLANVADLVIELSQTSPSGAALKILAWSGERGRHAANCFD